MDASDVKAAERFLRIRTAGGTLWHPVEDAAVLRRVLRRLVRHIPAGSTFDCTTNTDSIVKEHASE